MSALANLPADRQRPASRNSRAGNQPGDEGLTYEGQHAEGNDFDSNAQERSELHVDGPREVLCRCAFLLVHLSSICSPSPIMNLAQTMNLVLDTNLMALRLAILVRPETVSLALLQVHKDHLWYVSVESAVRHVV